MNFNLIRPCPGCPFSTGEKAVRYLGRRRACEIVESLVVMQKTFSCHEVNEKHGYVETKDAEHCAGALIMLEKIERPNQMMRWMERIGYYDHTKLDMDAPVFETFDDFVEAQAEGTSR